MEKWKQRARDLKLETFTLLLAYRDIRTPWYAKVTAGLVLAYAFSPIDLIPDFIPVLGYLDDLILLPLGAALAIRMIPPQVMQECRARAAVEMASQRPVKWISAVMIIMIWFTTVLALMRWIWGIFN